MQSLKRWLIDYESIGGNELDRHNMKIISDYHKNRPLDVFLNKCRIIIPIVEKRLEHPCGKDSIDIFCTISIGICYPSLESNNDEIKEELNLTDSEIIKSMKRLESKKKINIKSVMENSKWTTAIYKVDDYGLTPKTKKKSPKLVWNTFNDCPCFLCPRIHKCSSGQNYNNPKNCEHLTKWLEASVNNVAYISPFHPNFELKKKKRPAGKDQAKEEVKVEAVTKSK